MTCKYATYSASDLALMEQPRASLAVNSLGRVVGEAVGFGSGGGLCNVGIADRTCRLSGFGIITLFVRVAREGVVVRRPQVLWKLTVVDDPGL